MQQSTITLIVSCLGIAGTYGGIVLGQRMARSWQREQWLLDCRKDEFRELLSSLAKAYSTMQLVSPEFDFRGFSPEQEKLLDEAAGGAFAVIHDRIFIAFEIQEMNVLGRWQEIAKSFHKPHSVKSPDSRFTELKIDLVVCALKIPNSRSRPRPRQVGIPAGG